MNPVIQKMLKKYDVDEFNAKSGENAFKEIIQEIALLGLWRAKFFEHAAFYGGTALRLLYGLDRFSEDLDFSLLVPDPNFRLARYHNAVRDELESLGMKVEIHQKDKRQDSVVQSAFVKANTQLNDFVIRLERKVLKVKFEVDTQPPPYFNTEVLVVYEPIEFAVRAVSKPDLFAGKLHALLCRNWRGRIKGRDWFDWVWYVKQKIPVHLRHLEAKMKQSGNLEKSTRLTEKLLVRMLEEAVDSVEMEKVLADIRPYIKDTSRLEAWSKDMFREIIKRTAFA